MRCQYNDQLGQCRLTAEKGFSMCADHKKEDLPTSMVEREPEAIEVQKTEGPLKQVLNAQGDIVVFAKNPAEMEMAQASLAQWAMMKVEEYRIELEDLRANLRLAKKNKWKTSNWRSRISLARRRMEFYEKVEAALRAGYCLVPNFDVDIFAVRTTKEKPEGRGTTEEWASLPDQKTNAPPSGEGEYVNIQAKEGVKRIKKPNDKGELVSMRLRYPRAHDEVDFPFGFAKPQVLDATGKAMAHKIFDEIGVLPQYQRRRRGDPVVVGKITRKEGYNTTVMTFLISWFIDTRQM
jgi:hypothetical protein